MKIVTYIFLISLLLLGICFAMLNSEVVAINYFIGRHQMPLSMLLVIVFAIGCILGVIIVGTLLIKTKMQNHQLRKRLKITEKEIENLRAIPLQNAH